MTSTILKLITGMEISPTGCMLWPQEKANSGNGYGRIFNQGRSRGTHVVAYETFIGPVPKGMVVDHLCRNRRCFNPNHLEPKTGRHNTLVGDGPTARNARKLKCVRGHELSGANLKIRIRGGHENRECLACIKIRRKKR